LNNEASLKVKRAKRYAVAAGRSLTWAIALLVVVGFPRAARAQLSVDQLEVFLRPDLATQRTGVIRVTNHGDKAVQVLLEIQDWDRDSTGANQFHPLGKLPHSCRQQLRAFPMALRIDAKATEAVRVSFEGEASAACWGIVFLQSNEPPRATAGQSQITYVIRTGVKVYVEPRNAERVGDIDDVVLTTAPASETDTTRVRALGVVFRNSGKAHLKPKGAIEIRDENNVVAAKLEIAEFYITPAAVRRQLLPLPKLKPGRYVALALLDYGGAEIAAGQHEFEIK
jgi:P pilus assembly chaperone PapD